MRNEHSEQFTNSICCRTKVLHMRHKAFDGNMADESRPGNYRARCSSSARLRGAGLRGPRLRGPRLRGARLRGARLRLRGARLRGAGLRGVLKNYILKNNFFYPT